MTPTRSPVFEGPVTIIAGRLDSVVGYAAAVDLVKEYAQASLAVIEGAGHALPHEKPELLGALLRDWVERVERSG